MDRAKVISFDVEGTLVTPQFSRAIWDEAIPALYARKKGLGLEQAKALIQQEYELVGEQRIEWYDIGFWFRHFGLENFPGLLSSQRHQIALYPEVEGVLSTLRESHKLVIVSSSTREFLDLLLEGIRDYFVGIFSSISDYKELKTADFYLKVCERLKVKPEEMAHIGDNWELDFAIPRQVGIQAFYLDREGKRRDYRAVKDLKEFLAKFTLSHQGRG